MGSPANDGERPARDRELRRLEAKTLRALRQAAPPQRDGEPVFGAPWESRAFSVAVALHERGVFTDWEEFRSRLIAEIADWERASRDTGATWNYYERWLAALERLVVDRGILSRPEIDARASECAKPAGHAARSDDPSRGGT
jgi:nitrile hydratase accessory protein